MNTIGLDDVLARLTFVRRSGRGFSARCPAHDDRSPSLSVREVNGHPVVHCFAGCADESVWLALGLERPWAPVTPRTPFQEALRMGWAQQRRQHYDDHQDAFRMIAAMRADATRLGDGEEAWEMLDAAAEMERLTWNTMWTA